jgi:hypothetical protein
MANQLQAAIDLFAVAVQTRAAKQQASATAIEGEKKASDAAAAAAEDLTNAANAVHNAHDAVLHILEAIDDGTADIAAPAPETAAATA